MREKEKKKREMKLYLLNYTSDEKKCAFCFLLCMPEGLRVNCFLQKNSFALLAVRKIYYALIFARAMIMSPHLQVLYEIYNSVHLFFARICNTKCIV